MASCFACMPLLWLCYGCWILGVVCELNDFDRECANIHFEEWILRVWFFVIFVWSFCGCFKRNSPHTRNSQKFMRIHNPLFYSEHLYGFVWISYEIDLLFAWILRNPVQNVSFFPTWAFLDWKRDKFTSTHRWEPLGWISGSSTSLLWPKWFLIEIISSACNQLFRSHDIKTQMLNLVVWKTTPFMHHTLSYETPIFEHGSNNNS